MRSKLSKFTDFTNTLLPHETQYLLSIQRFEDEERLLILHRIDHNAHHIDQFTEYDLSIDKRKYNHLQNWIEERLRSTDVDDQLKWMLSTEQQILTDSILIEQEKRLLKLIRTDQQPVYFNTFYELAEHYRQFLLIRLRYHDHQLVDEYLQRHREAYQRSKEVHEQLHQATLDIVGQYDGQQAESRQWEQWLAAVFHNEQLDWHLRYLALLRLTFLCYNYRKYDLLREKFAYLEKQFLAGTYYSRRLLLNYYNTQLMLHSHYREYDQAVYFGYLSIRAQNHDYPLYVNNLCAVLLRLKRNEEALELMKKAAPAVKKTTNFHNRIGFVAFYMEALNKNGLYQNAESYGNIFLRAYAKEVLRYRWHLFFSVYLESLLQQEKYDKVLKTEHKYRLMQRDKKYENNANYQATIPLFTGLAQLKEGHLKKEEFADTIQALSAKYSNDEQKLTNLKKLLKQILEWAPGLKYLIK